MYTKDSRKQKRLFSSGAVSLWHTKRINSLNRAKKRRMQLLILLSSTLLFSGFAHSSDEQRGHVEHVSSIQSVEEANKATLLLADNGAAVDAARPILLSKADTLGQPETNIPGMATGFQVKTNVADKAQTDRLGSGLDDSVLALENMEATSVMLVVLGLLSLVWVARRA